MFSNNGIAPIIISICFCIGLFFTIINHIPHIDTKPPTEVFLYVFTVGAWAFDAFVIKKAYKVNSTTIYSDLSFVCLISYESDILSNIENTSGISLRTYFYYFLSSVFMFTLWSANFVISDKYNNEIMRAFAFLISIISVAFLVASISILNWIISIFN